MCNCNKAPKVVQQPTKYNGGSNAPVTPVTKPTRYTGGNNAPATVSPTKK
jgi:hypothetical protein